MAEKTDRGNAPKLNYLHQLDNQLEVVSKQVFDLDLINQEIRQKKTNQEKVVKLIKDCRDSSETSNDLIKDFISIIEEGDNLSNSLECTITCTADALKELVIQTEKTAQEILKLKMNQEILVNNIDKLPIKPPVTSPIMQALKQLGTSIKTAEADALKAIADGLEAYQQSLILGGMVKNFGFDNLLNIAKSELNFNFYSDMQEHYLKEKQINDELATKLKCKSQENAIAQARKESIQNALAAAKAAAGCETA